MRFIFLFSFVVSAFFIVSPVNAQVQNTPRTLVKSTSSTAVYYIGDDGKRHGFPNSKVYFSWYDDFSDVIEISDFELAQIPLGKNVLYRSGSRLIKTPSVNEVYAVGPWGELRNIATEAVAISLYGQDWAKLVDDIDISFFFDYHIVGVIDSDGENIIYPRGSLIHNDGLTWVIDTRSTGVQIVRPISGQAWIENNFDDLLTYKYTGFVTDQYEVGIPVYGEEARFTCVYCTRNEFDNVTVFEKKFFNLALDKYKVSGNLPENWNVMEQVNPNELELSSSDGELVGIITVLDHFNADNFSDYFAGLDSEPPVIYKGVGLDNSSNSHMIYQNPFNSAVQLYSEFKVYEDFIVIFSIAAEDVFNENFDLEKHWDEIEVFLKEVDVTRVAS